MRAVVQRVARAEVRVDGKPVGSIGRGLLVLLGVGAGDGEEDARFMADKLGEVFTGYITGVQAFGLFVELTEVFVQGLVHVSSM